MPHVHFATYADRPEGQPDDHLGADALRALGVDVTFAPWDAPWPGDAPPDAVVIRSTWDYFERLDAFTAWLDRLDAAATPVFNDTATIRGNVHKRYLRDLAAAGVPIVETAWPAPGEALADVLAQHGWADAVVKPAVSGGAYETRRVSLPVDPADAAWYDALRAHVDLLVQPFRADVVERGEVSLLYFDGAFSHAVVKAPKAGDYRVQVQHGGVYARYEADARLVGAGRDVLAAAGAERLAFVRVDGLVRDDGGLDLMELELIEPALFLTYDPGSPQRFARALAARL